MKHVKRSVLLWYAPREMYALVTDIDAYPQFLPWCERAEVVEQRDGSVTARLTLAKGGVRHAFTTRNVHRPDERVDVALIDGPFSVLEGCWLFVPIGRGGDTDPPQACRIEFDLRYAFASRALEAVVSPVFDRIADTMVDSFVQRAESVYGAR